MFIIKPHFTIMNINWHIANVYFNGVKSSIEFKFNEYTPLADPKYILENLLPYSDNWKIVKLEYCSLTIEHEWKIEFNKFEMETGADLRAMWNTFFYYNQKFDQDGCDDFGIGDAYPESKSILEFSRECGSNI